MTFDNQPLNDVALTATLLDEIELSLEFIFEFGKALEGAGWVISTADQFFAAPGKVRPAVQFHEVQTIQGFKAVRADGCALHIQIDSIRASWSKSSGCIYPRFEELLAVVRQACDLFEKVTGGALSIAVANLTYASVLETVEERPIGWFFKPSVLPAIAIGTLSQANAVWSEAGYDFRYTLVRTSDTTDYTIATAGGKRLDEGDNFWDVATQLNLKLNKLFKEMISQEVEKLWQLQY